MSHINIRSKPLHCTDGPAIDGNQQIWRILGVHISTNKVPNGTYVSFGITSHWKYGVLHNDNGPALIHKDGAEWYIDGVFLKKE